MAAQPYFSPELFRFLKQLKRNNRREWFAANKGRYEEFYRDAALRFVADMVIPMRKISTWIAADPRPQGGSVFRIYRDTRFSSDKTPYKTHLGIQFTHAGANEEVHDPCFYLHLEPDNCFAAAGCWHPDTRSLARIRDAIAWKPEDWKKAKRGLALEGDSLSRAPRGYPATHPMLADLKRKDYVATVAFREEQVLRPQFPREFLRACEKLSPLTAFLCKALGLAF